MDLNFALHPPQAEIFNSPARFKLCVSGRRFGKSYLAAVICLVEGLKNEARGYSLKDKDVFYVAPSFNQGKDILWRLIRDLGHPIIEQAYENTGQLRLINGRRIHIKGSDKPDSLRGVGLSYVVLDEYATMKPETWESILRPTLSDVEGGALFIGTPQGKNHFYNLYSDATQDAAWDVFEYKSVDNPFLNPAEIEHARKQMSTDNFKQEFEASFAVGSGRIFKEDWVNVGPEIDGHWYLAFDPAGFSEEKLKASKLKKLDECAIACVKVGLEGWYVDDIITGRWGVREASLQLLRACQKYKPMACGIEKGALKNALMPYLQDQQRRLGIFPNIVETTHGGQKKAERVAWDLQGRLEHGRVFFKDGPYLNKFITQLVDFPNPMAHDDMVDALSYIAHVSKTIYNVMDEEEWQPIDEVAGY